MSCLLVDELLPGTIISQHFRTYRDTDVAAIRFGVYKHNNTVADIKLSVYQDDVLIAESKVITAAEINAAWAQPYAYGLLKFEFENHLNLHVKEGETKTEYEMRVESNNGTNLAFLGVYRKWEEQIYLGYNTPDTATFEQAVNDTIEPYHFEIYEYKYT